MRGKTYLWDEQLIAARRAFRARWEERRRPLGDGAPEEKPVPVALAAYLLGRGGNVCRLEQRMARDAGEPAGECPGGLPRTGRDLEKALEALKGLIRPRRYETLRGIPSRCHPAGEGPAPDGPAPEGPVVALPERLSDDLTWQRFRRLATDALPPDTGLGVLAVLGAVVGGVELGLYVRGVDPEGGPDRADEDLLIRALIQAATALPWECTRDVPLLAEARRLAPEVMTGQFGDPRAAMMQLAPAKKLVKLPADSPWIELRYEDMVLEIDFNIQEGLIRINSPHHLSVLMERAIPRSDPSSSEGEADRGRSRYLGLRLAETDREVRRDGYDSPVRFGGNSRLWDLLKAFVLARGVILSLNKLYDQVWRSVGSHPENSTIQWAIHELKRRMDPLGTVIENCKGVGYRLVDSSAASVGPGGSSTGRRRRTRSATG
jgi:DNA-binding winged helix-turn-helix (wHTH) protein